MNNYYVYVLSSTKRNYHYIGITDDIERRVSQHNKGYNKTTKPYYPYKIIIKESYDDRGAARKREKWLKSGVGRDYIKNLKVYNS